MIDRDLRRFIENDVKNLKDIGFSCTMTFAYMNGLASANIKVNGWDIEKFNEFTDVAARWIENFYMVDLKKALAKEMVQ